MKIPSITLKDQDGKDIRLPDVFLNKYTILYFYPKDDTPGCTKQACSYRDNMDEFTKLGAQVIGVSLDDVASHTAFREKYTLNFPLLCDTEHVLSEALGVYGDQEWGGRVFKGLSRDTFLIGPQGNILREWRKVNPGGTMAETLAALQEVIC